MDGLLNTSALALRDTPLKLKATLREYQKQGYVWLQFLVENNLGGILADDMGLGKTMQALALIDAAVHKHKGNFRALIVAPTSVVENWDLEIARFAPHLHSAVLRKGDRSHIHTQLKKYHVIVSSYALLLRDFEKLNTEVFDVLILDEAQYAKNYQARTASHRPNRKNQSAYEYSAF
mgnify:CR=1 FL=1